MTRHINCLAKLMFTVTKKWKGPKIEIKHSLQNDQSFKKIDLKGNNREKSGQCDLVKKTFSAKKPNILMIKIGIVSSD